MALTKGRKRVLLKQLTKAVGDSDVMGGKHASLPEIRKHRLEFPGHMVEGVEAIVMEEINGLESRQQSWELLPAVSYDQIPARLHCRRHEEIVRGFALFPAELDAVQRPLSILGEGGEDVATNGTVENPGFDHRPWFGGSNQEVQAPAVELSRRSDPIGSGERLQVLNALVMPAGKAGSVVLVIQCPGVDSISLG
jgi:hypothetical protein